MFFLVSADLAFVSGVNSLCFQLWFLEFLLSNLIDSVNKCSWKHEQRCRGSSETQGTGVGRGQAKTRGP